MSRQRRRVLVILGSLAGISALLVIAAIIILQTAWFANFAKDKIVAGVEDSTGGRVEVGSLDFDLWHLTVKIRNFVLHGKEPAGSEPLARVDLLELRAKLFSGIAGMLDLRYLGIQHPQVHLMVMADGSTNMPEPKAPSKPSQTSGLETVVNLAVKEFRLENGRATIFDQPADFRGQGENLRVLLSYNFAQPSYRGNVAMDPLVLMSGSNTPLRVRVNVPIALEKDAIRVRDARLTTGQSQVILNASVENMNTPALAARVDGRFSLPELQKSLALPIDTTRRGAPQELTLALAATVDQKSNRIALQDARVMLGQTSVQASGSLQPGTQEAVRFRANVALAEVAALMNVSGLSAQGFLDATGSAKLDLSNNYAIDGNIDTRGLAIRSGTTQISNVELSSPVHADPYLVSMDGLKLSALGGSLAAKIFLEKLQNLSVEGTLRSFSLPVLAAVFSGERIGYDGVLNGSLAANGDLKAKGTTGYSAEAHLTITPGTHGVPVTGRLNATYQGARGALDLGESFLQLPHSRLDMSGSLNRELDLKLLSQNLDDFLPALNIGSAQPQTTMPVVLRNGTAQLQAKVRGNLAAPEIAAHLDINSFAVEQKVFQRAALDLSASQSGAALRNGLVQGEGLQAKFDGSIGLRKWKPTPGSELKADLSVPNGDLGAIASLAGQQALQAAGQLAAEVHINGTYGNPLGNAHLQVSNGSVSGQTFSQLNSDVSLSDQLVQLSRLELDMAGGAVTASGTYRHRRDNLQMGHADVTLAAKGIQLAQVESIAKQQAGVAGLIQLSANAKADLDASGKQTNFAVSEITADLSAHHLQVQNQNAGDLTASARTAGGQVQYQLNSDFAGSEIGVQGRTALTNDHATVADATIKNLSIVKALQLAGQSSIPASGDFSAKASVTGTLSAPNAELSFLLRDANVYQEPIGRLAGAVHYSGTEVQIRSLELAAPAGTLTASGRYVHAPNNFNTGSVELKLNTDEVQAGKIQALQRMEPRLGGSLHVAADLSARLEERHGGQAFELTKLNGDLSTTGLRVNGRQLGGINFTARTNASNLDLRLDSDLVQSQVHGSGQMALAGDYATHANLSFTNVRYSNIAPFLPDQTPGPLPYEALVEGQATVNGPLLNTNALSARLQLTRLDLKTNPQGSPTGAAAHRTLEVQNQGPITLSLEKSVVHVEQMRIEGPGASLDASGTVNLNSQQAFALNLNAHADLSGLQDVSKQFYSSGTVTLNTAIRGSLSEPRANGRVELQNANINYSESPNGISNANGVILLNGTNAAIQNLTGESGGGKISLTGFVGFGTGIPSFNVRAAATKVRVRYSGISGTSDATIALTGNLKRSLLAGTVTVHRIAYASSSDAGSLLSTASVPPSTPSSPSILLSGMRLAIRVVTGPDLQVVSTYSNRLSVLANLDVRGTAATPGIVGRMTVTDGQLVFFGNTYTVNTGTINFYDPNTISPILNVSLETIAQGVDVTIGVSGPMDNLKLSYRSDPPLTFEQIVQLLATNTTPSNPVIAAHQPVPAQQSLSQMGESAVLGQAVANPLASRVQRVFGLTQFKIDPSFSGSNGTPDARVTLQEKIASNITFTYITDVSQANAEIVRVQWDLTNNLSAVGLRDYNGNVSVEVFYKFSKR